MPLTAQQWITTNVPNWDIQDFFRLTELYAKYYHAELSRPPKDVVEAIETYCEQQIPNANAVDAPYCTTGDRYEEIKAAALHGYSLAAGESVRFAEWKDKHCQRFGDWWGTLYAGDGGKLYTTEQLFELFKKERNG